MSNEMMLREQLVELAKRLIGEGLVIRTWGNFSMKLGDDEMLITPTGRGYENMDPSELVKISLITGEVIDENGFKPSSEAPMHILYYNARPDANVVLHTHQVYASALSLVRGEHPLDSDMADIVKARSLPISEYGLPGTKKLHGNMAKTLESSEAMAVLMARHGAFIGGSSADEALLRAKEIEEWAKRRYDKLVGRESFKRSSIDLDVKREDEFIIRDKEYVMVPSQDTELSFLQLGGEPLRPYLDDFAQICGVEVSEKRKKASAHFSSSVGIAYCFGKNEADARNVRAVLEKNVRACHIGLIYGQKPINKFESFLMRTIYQKSYSKKATCEQ